MTSYVTTLFLFSIRIFLQEYRGWRMNQRLRFWKEFNFVKKSGKYYNPMF